MSARMTRREFAILAGATALARPAFAQTGALLTRAIPKSGEQIPAVGLGTAQVFDTADAATGRRPPRCSPRSSARAGG
jgi:hypothetical protein